MIESTASPNSIAWATDQQLSLWSASENSSSTVEANDKFLQFVSRMMLPASRSDHREARVSKFGGLRIAHWGGGSSYWDQRKVNSAPRRSRSV